MNTLTWYHVQGAGHVEIIDTDGREKIVLRGYDGAVYAKSEPAAFVKASKELMMKASQAGYDVVGWYWDKKPVAELLGKVEMEMAI